MNSEQRAPVIEVADLGKAFKTYRSARHRALDWLPLGGPQHQLHWVLRHLDFQIPRGQSVGLVGRNGAGKSTLLKLITATLQPTEGRLQVRGSVAALLELGLGFHPQFSGEENALMAGQLMGYTREQMRACLAEIRAFSELGSAMQAPVRTYSSGMVVRLAFATATAIVPQVLIVDEALAVGDAAFQHKCYDRIRAFRQQGVTLLFVSHDPLAVKTLCDRAILIDQGRIAIDAAPDVVLDHYNALIASPHDANLSVLATGAAGGVRSGDGAVRIVRVELFSNGRSAAQLCESDPLRIELHLEVVRDVPALTLGFLIKDRMGNEISGTNTLHLGYDQPLRQLAAGQSLRVYFDLPALPLGPGAYTVTLAAHASESHLVANHDWWDRAAAFEVLPGTRPKFSGVVRLPVEVQILRA